jgi:hypothetical protein
LRGAVEPTEQHQHKWEGLVWRPGQLGPDWIDWCKCGLWRIRPAERTSDG